MPRINKDKLNSLEDAQTHWATRKGQSNLLNCGGVLQVSSFGSHAGVVFGDTVLCFFESFLLM